jgi:sugar phosphate isomerase/epimerase/protein-tyrosine-phosphatase
MNTCAQSLQVLFVCTGNAGRSQLAQAAAASHDDDLATYESAGVKPWAALHPTATKLMRERGVNDAAHYPKDLAALANRSVDVVVTIGDPACELLPQRIPGNPYRFHWDIADPAEADGTPESEAVFRATLAQIEQRISGLRAQLARLSSPSLLRSRPGINSGLWSTEVLHESHLALAVEAGFKAMEVSPYINLEHFDVRDADHVRRIGRGAKDNGLAIWSLHSRDVGDLTSPDPAARQAQLDELRWCLDAADMLGATAVVSHIQVVGRHFSDLASAEARLADGMDELAPRAEVSAARIALENGYARRNGQWTRDMFRRVAPFSSAAFGYVIDTGHAHIAGDLEDIENGVGQRLISLHLNDNDGDHDIHLTGGQGTVDWARVARLLRATDYDGCLMWEIGVGRDEFNPQMLTDAMRGHQHFMEHLQVLREQEQASATKTA